MPVTFDVVVVGAGPAGSSAALVAAQAGLKVLLIERGEYIGAKNVTGGMFLSQILEKIVPNYWEEAPLERPITSQRIMMTSGARDMTVQINNTDNANPPFNGWSVLRHKFDDWLACKAQEAGATVITSTVVDSLLIENGSVVGVKTRREYGEVRAPITVLADGVNSLLAHSIGLAKKPNGKTVGLGVKELLELPSDVINDRFGVSDNGGASYAVIGDFARHIPGGAFIYTNKNSVSIGIVAHPAALSEQNITIDDVLERFKNIPNIARLIKDAKLIEYSGHLIPEGGLGAMAKLQSAGVLVAGDAAGFAINTGITLQGINLAVDSGICAGEATIKAHKAKNFSEATLSEYTRLLDQSVTLSSMKAHAKAPEFVALSRMSNEYPDLVNDLLQRLTTIGATPQPSLTSIAKQELKKIGYGNLLHDVRLGMKAL
ncbi:dehydrogenase [Actinomycetota bacterium]|nr:dehydrogenase [Actinomycetota bacterium]